MQSSYAAVYKLVYLFLFESIEHVYANDTTCFNSNGLMPSSVDLIFDFTCLGDSTRVHLL